MAKDANGLRSCISAALASLEFKMGTYPQEFLRVDVIRLSVAPKAHPLGGFLATAGSSGVFTHFRDSPYFRVTM